MPDIEPRPAAQQARRIVAALMLIAASLTGHADDWRFDAPRIFAISDVHGDYDAFVATLAGAGIIDDALGWAAADAALVITGDLLDRGAESRRVMDLVMSLEGEAEAAGGRVHLLLGNHEVMNLVGDLRYVADGEYAAFEEDEDPEEREAALERIAGAEADEAAREAFDARFPPGFFAHRRAFRPDGQYGAWLLEKPLLIVVNDTAFTHGGLSPMVTELGLDGVNAFVDDLRRYAESLAVLTDEGLIAPDENFYRHALALEGHPALEAGAALDSDSGAEPEGDSEADAGADTESAPDDAETGSVEPDDADADADGGKLDTAAAVRTIVELNESPIHDTGSPLWYRGNVGCSAPVEADRLDAALAAIDAGRVVVGHTPTASREVLTRLDGRVFEIDTGMLTDYYRGSGNALILDGESVAVRGEDAAEPRSVTDHPRRVGYRAAPLSAAELERVFSEGEVAPDAAAGEDGAVKVTLDGQTVPAIFIRNSGRRGLAPDLAAYRLDRFLGLDMVPVTVRREFDGDDGVLQYRPPQTANEAERRESGRGGSAHCPLPDQWDAMYVFDSLIHNPARVQDRMLYSPDNWQLILVGHDASFPTSKGRPAYLREMDLAIGEEWRRRLEALDAREIESVIGDSLDRRRKRALLARRDSLLKDSE